MTTKSNLIRWMMGGGLILLVTVFLMACQADDRAGHDDHGGHDHAAQMEEDDHDDHGGEGAVHLEPDVLREFGVILSVAGPDSIHREIRLPGEVRLDEDRIAHVMPAVPGNVHTIHVKEGDWVERGQVLAVIHSQDLANASSALLEAHERLRLADANYERSKTLRAEGISSQQELQSAERELKGASIALRSAEQTLHAIGIDDEMIERLHDDPSIILSHHELRSPIAGQVIKRTVVQGQRADEGTDAFIIADLSTVWVDADVYPRDLGVVREGMPVRIVAGYGIPTVSGHLSYVGPIVGKETRTAVARTVVSNPDGLLRPGLFVNVQVATQAFPVEVAVPRTALVNMEGLPHVFVQEGDEFHPVEVVLGMENDTHVEIVEGITLGQTYVSVNGFILKSEMEKASFGDGHGH